MHRDDLLLTICLFGIFAITAFFYFLPMPWINYEIFTDLILTLFPLIAFFGGIWAAKSYGLKNFHGKSLLFITAGLGCWFVGELLWAIYQIVLHIDPYPSIADVFYLLAYPLVLIGIIREINNYKTEISAVKSLVISCISILMSIIVFYIMIVPVFGVEGTLVENIISISYGIADVVLIVTILHMLILTFGFRGGRLFHGWLSILLAAMFMLVADVLFAQYNLAYSEAIPLYKKIDLLWVISYMFFALGLFEMKFIIRDVQHKIKQLL